MTEDTLGHVHEAESGRITRAEPRTFMGAPRCENLEELSARIAMLGVPYDFGTIIPRLRQGTSRGPNAVRDAQFHYRSQCLRAVRCSSALQPKRFVRLIDSFLFGAESCSQRSWSASGVPPPPISRG